jgi:ubiquinone/menaquinone biosynthesis C-methylase UbiE
MDLNEAIELITFENKTSYPQRWLDLGCGSGLFTLALTNQLPASSTIIAIDKNEKVLRQIPATYNNVNIETHHADFINDDLEVKNADGILMANSFHYVKNKESFLDKLIPVLKKKASFLLVEYDRAAANAWVPYPITLDRAKELFKEFGYPDFRVLGKKPSVYGSHNMYAAIIN